MKIEVAALFGENCITAEDGRALHGRISDALATLQKGERVEVDFANTAVFSSPFFNAAVGELLRDHEPVELNAKVALLGLSADGYALVERVIKNAREYFSNPRVRKTVDELTSMDSGEHSA
jgi:hypothetical protein